VVAGAQWEQTKESVLRLDAVSGATICTDLSNPSRRSCTPSDRWILPWVGAKNIRHPHVPCYFNFTNSKTKIAHTPTVTGN
jgi:hypothetical protein